MALAMAGENIPVAALNAVWRAEWSSSGLKDDRSNPFTPALVLRASGVARTYKKVDDKDLRRLRHPLWGRKRPGGVKAHVGQLHRGLAETLRVGQYPPSPTIAYWLLDAAMRLGGHERLRWDALVKWGAEEFARQRVRVAAGNDTTADPVSMAMAACLLRGIRRHARGEKLELESSSLGSIPPHPDLANAIQCLFEDHQRPSGIWGKYFPLFHYPEGGANHCFSFELLEAIVAEFGSDSVLRSEWMLCGLERAVTWCEGNRLEFTDASGSTFCGWNSGGRIESVLRGEPESWATAVVHMFLRTLEKALSADIRNTLWGQYDAAPPGHDERRRWDEFLDIEIDLPSETNSRVKPTLEKHMLSRLGNGTSIPKNVALSALLFGPPGTSKSSLARAVADRLRWRYVEITPSHFLGDGIDHVYQHATHIFEDLFDLSQTVILFDELDGLVHDRRSGNGVATGEGGIQAPASLVDVRREFLTTSMLPKLSELHSRRNVVFFWATNHLSGFDPAIRRPGRFDLIVQMGPPCLDEKLGERGLRAFDGRSDVTLASYENASRLLREVVERLDADALDNLRHFTFGDMRALVRRLRRDRELSAAIAETTASGLATLILDFATVATLAAPDQRAAYQAERKLSRVQY